MNDLEMGKRIRELREQNNITRDVFAEKIGISTMYLCQIEKGQRHGSLPLVVRIAKVLNVSIDYLIYGNNSIDINRQEVIKLVNNASNRQLEIIKSVLLNLKK